MTMARVVSEIDRLIEEGLSLYGEGDLDGALLLWERVLVIEPENAQANSYVDYVRMNYELLTSDSSSDDDTPFGIGSDEPEYQIEISPGDSSEEPAPMFMDGRDHGWGLGDEATGRSAQLPKAITLELEAEEPPPGGDPATFEAGRGGEDVSFDIATREYPGGRGRPARKLLDDGPPPAEPADFNEVTPGFGSAEDVLTPHGFGSQTTDVRRRDLGFVQPTEPGHRADTEPGQRAGTEPGHRAGTEPGHRAGPGPGQRANTGPGQRANTGPPELRMTLRTPNVLPAPLTDVSPAQPDANEDAIEDLTEELDPRTVTADLEPDDGPPGPPGLELDLGIHPDALADPSAPYAALDLDLPAMPSPSTAPVRTDSRSGPVAAPDRASADLLASLPSPQPTAGMTRPMPAQTRPPAFDPPHGAAAKAAGGERPTRDITLEPTETELAAAGIAPTQELPYVMRLDPRLAHHPNPDPLPQPAFGSTLDFADKPTHPRTKHPTPRALEPIITAPTRDLGLRYERRPATDDETTGQVDLYRRRPMTLNGQPEPVAMDPIDARSADILEQVDSGAPAIETREERTRRRISALLDRAVVWGRDAEVDRAVTAVDLALSEDPNSALAQKLIHRNRETIMSAFQAYLGDLSRTPVLARPLHELGSAPISPRAAFLLSRVDGTLSLDEILDVSGMPRLEAYRYLCQLFLRGILR